MKEITMVTTCEITDIAIVTDEDADFVIGNQDMIKDLLPDQIKEDLGVDNVNILKNQIFIRDLPEEPDTQ